MNIPRTPNIVEMILRPVIRNDRPHEVYNKMTDEEFMDKNREMERSLREKEISQSDWMFELMSMQRDYAILYDVISMDKQIQRAIKVCSLTGRDPRKYLERELGIEFEL